MHPSVELPPIQNHVNPESVPPFHSPRPRELLPSMLEHSPPGRSSTLPPMQRKESIKRDKPARPRKSSITQNSRRPKHEKTKSKEQNRRLSIEGRKAFSAEPPGAVAAAAMGKRWEDLIEAATSATEVDSDRDLTPVWPPDLVRSRNQQLMLADSSIAGFDQTCIHASFFQRLLQSILQSLTSAEHSDPTPFTHSRRTCAVLLY